MWKISESFSSLPKLKINKMTTTLTKDYARFVALMTDGKLYINPAVSFHVACLLLGADEKALGKLVESETGFTGDELIDSYRKSYCEFLLKNFGIRL